MYRNGDQNFKKIDYSFRNVSLSRIDTFCYIIQLSSLNLLIKTSLVHYKDDLTMEKILTVGPDEPSCPLSPCIPRGPCVPVAPAGPGGPSGP